MILRNTIYIDIKLNATEIWRKIKLGDPGFMIDRTQFSDDTLEKTFGA
jgi:hypothetical protein